jgi:hypothetical protein
MATKTKKTTTPTVETPYAEPAPAPVAARPSGVDGIIPDGHRWTSSTGRACYKVPVDQMRAVMFTLPKVDVSAFTDAQLTKAQAYIEERYAERKHPETGAAEVYLVFPVSYAKQADVNNRYWSALATFSKAVNAELAQRSVSQLFGM